eukprot:SAG31_NODE_2557_length_5492_cov_13.987762_6_plen_53_part_00
MSKKASHKLTKDQLPILKRRLEKYSKKIAWIQEFNDTSMADTILRACVYTLN